MKIEKVEAGEREPAQIQFPRFYKSKDSDLVVLFFDQNTVVCCDNPGEGIAFGEFGFSLEDCTSDGWEPMPPGTSYKFTQD